PWTEGAAALGVNRWRVTWTIAVRTARPAIVAAAVLATARALGEAIMLSMVSGSVGFAPNPLDGITFFLEPARPLAATIVDNAEGLSVKPFGQTMYAFAAVLLVSSMFLSLGGWAAKQPLRKYGVRA
ncbi:MAG: ABC transporter permease subunit, partial [Thermoleophilaceae bacterium]|nr:ABC transporter permease subunit [Thermoleophilaceae bacterium]